MFVPRFSFESSSIISNPFYVEYYNSDYQSDNYHIKKGKIIELSKLSFPKYGILLVFDDKSITFCIDPQTKKEDIGNILVEPLVRYLIFSTYRNYNIVGGPKFTHASLNEISETDRIKVKVGYISQIQQHKGSITKIIPSVLEIEKDSIENYLSVINRELYLAISYYLIGCQNIEYFLVEFYKSIEIIKNFFGKETLLNNGLKPMGFNLSEYKTLKRYGDDERNPLNIGRHAPKKNAELTFIDIKRLLEEPKSKQVFEDSTRICRNIINKFIDYLVKERSI